MQKDLTQGNPFKTLIRFVLPIIAGNLFQLFYTLADTIIVGQTMGANALAAVGATSNVVALVLSFIEGIASGFSIIAGQHIGAKQSDDTRISIIHSVYPWYHHFNRWISSHDPFLAEYPGQYL